MTEHRIALGLYRAVTASDPRVELFDTANGMICKGIAVGEVSIDETYGPVQTMTLDMIFQGTNKSRDDAVQRAKQVQTLLRRGQMYLERKGGNLPSSTDGTWHEGHAVTLTQFLDGLSRPVYWNVLSGNVLLPPNYMDARFSGGALFGTITLTVQAAARGSLVTLDNLVACGDFAPPFSVYDSAFTAGWSFNVPTHWSISTEQAWWGDRSLKALGSSSDFFASNGSAAVVPGDVLVPALMVYVTAPLGGGTIPCALEYYNGSDWTTIPQDTFATLPTLPSGATLQPNTWTPVVGAAITLPAGTQQVRLAAGITSVATTTSIYFDGVAIWRNPASNQKPDEYVTGGHTLGMPHLNVYGVQGDAAAPVQLGIYPPVPAGFTTIGDTTYIGAMDIDTNVDLPLNVLDYRFTPPPMHASFNEAVLGGQTESGHNITVSQGTFATSGGSLTSTSDANGDAIRVYGGAYYYTQSVYVLGTLNSATNYRVPELILDCSTPPDFYTIRMKNGTVAIIHNASGTETSMASAATTTADGTAYLLSATVTSTQVIVKINGSTLITWTISTNPAIGGGIGLRLHKGGSPATAAVWDAWDYTPTSGGFLAGVTDAQSVWGQYAPLSVDSLIATPFTYGGGADITHMIDRIPRTYRAILAFDGSTASASAPFTALSFGINNEQAAFAQATDTHSTAHLFMDIGDYNFARPGVMWQNITEAIREVGSAGSVRITGTGGTSITLKLAGILLAPAEQFAVVRSASTFGFLLVNDGTKASAGNFDLGGWAALAYANYAPHDNMTLDGGEFSLSPSLGQRTHMTQFVILPTFSGSDNDARVGYHPIIKYVPQHSLGVA